MKKILYVIAMMAFCVNVWAASSMTVTVDGGSQNQFILKVACTSHTDGTFTSYQITQADAKTDYWKRDWYLGDAFVVNGASGQPDTAGAVTITDETGRQLVGTSAGDTLSVSTSASGTGYLSASRGAAQRSIFKKLTIGIGDTQSGSATSTFTLYLVFVK
jgi:hypothetical protein